RDFRKKVKDILAKAKPAKPKAEPPPEPPRAKAEPPAKRKKLSLEPVAFTEEAYQVKLPAEYRTFLQKKQYEKFQNHRPSYLPTYKASGPRVLFIAGPDVPALIGGKRFFNPAKAAKAGVEPGQYFREQAFQALQTSSMDEDELAQI